MFKKLRLGVTGTRDMSLAFYIIEQSHVGREFNPPFNYFEEFCNPVALNSDIHARFMGNSRQFMTVWSPSERNTDIQHLKMRYVPDLFDIVLKYNQKYNKNKLEMSDVVEGLELLEESNV